MNSHSTELTIIWVSIFLIIIQINCAVSYLYFSKNSKSPSTNNSPSPSKNNFEVLNEDHPVEFTEKLVVIKEENLDVNEKDSDSGVILIVPESAVKKGSKKDSKLNEKPEEKKNVDYDGIEGYLNDAEAPVSILKTRRETILNNILSNLKFQYLTPTDPLNRLIVGSKNLDKFLEEKVGLGNWTADVIDKEKIVELCDTSVILLQYYELNKDINFKITVKNVIDKIINKMNDLEFDKMPSRFYWTDFACKFVTLLLTYDFLINYQSGNLIYRDLINQLIPTVKIHEWEEMNYRRIINFLGLKLVVDYYFEPDLYGYDYFEKSLKILKDKFEEVQSKNLKTEVYNYDFMFQIYKSFCLD